ncbi:MAG: hypothetical protein RQ867_04820 [Mariprofundaceae bacterium]|nr:hypothetical protein [Mariprofundaceae bacterium]
MMGSKSLNEGKAQKVYIECISEASMRLLAAKQYLAHFNSSSSIPELESSILQVRKSLEAIAYSAIAPDKKQYAAFRAKAETSPDFTKDYHAAKIFSALNRINKNFYPLALVPFVIKGDGTKHFDKKTKGFLTKKRFEKVYDRLGKHLHAHNPWDNNKNIQNLTTDLPQIIEEAQGLLELHVRFIRTAKIQGAWVVEVDREGNQPPKVITAIAKGEFTTTSQ